MLEEGLFAVQRALRFPEEVLTFESVSGLHGGAAAAHSVVQSASDLPNASSVATSLTPRIVSSALLKKPFLCPPAAFSKGPQRGSSRRPEHLLRGKIVTEWFKVRRATNPGGERGAQSFSESEVLQRMQVHLFGAGA